MIRKVWKEKPATNFRLEKSHSNLSAQQHVQQAHPERKGQWDHLDHKGREAKEVKLVSTVLRVKSADKVFQGCQVTWVDQAHRALLDCVVHLDLKD